MQAAIRFLAVLIALVVLSPHSNAQTFDKRLEGITSVKIEVEDLNENDKRCGLTEDALRSAAAFPVATSRLNISDTSRTTLSIYVLTSSDPGQCRTAFEVYVFVSQVVLLAETNLRKSVRIRLWDRFGAGVASGPRGGFPDQIHNAIESLSKRFVVDWTLDQQ